MSASAGSDAEITPSGGVHDALYALAAELSALGWTSCAHTLPGRIPGLLASNPVPGATALSEDIYARPGPDGGWEYWWPWGERIVHRSPNPASVEAQAPDAGPERGSAVTGGGRR
jgi:hypothetical protein